MKSKSIISIIILTILLAVLVYLKPAGKFDNPKNAPSKVKPPPVLVSVKLLVPENIHNIVMTSGNILPNEEVNLVSEVAGRITEISFNEGTSVKKGDILMKLYDQDLQAQLRKNEIQIALAEKNESRQKQLLSVKGISQQDYDLAISQLNTLKAENDYIKTALEKTTIRAPFSGVAGLRNISAGGYINPNTFITKIRDISKLKVEFSIPEKYASQVKNGDKINFTVEGRNEKFEAKVYAIEPGLDVQSGTLKLRALYSNEGQKIVPGAFAKIELNLEDISNTLMIPTESVIPTLKGKKVFIVKNKKAESVTIETGIRNDLTIQVTKGLNAGDSLVVTGIMQLKPGSEVKIMKNK